jgi:hypothetical protein
MIYATFSKEKRSMPERSPLRVAVREPTSIPDWLLRLEHYKNPRRDGEQPLLRPRPA